MYKYSIQKLFDQEVEENLEIHSFYSSPSCYVKAVNEAAINLKSYHGDYFPYSSKTDFYWTGYYTSRPNLKLYERHANSILQVIVNSVIINILFH